MVSAEAQHLLQPQDLCITQDIDNYSNYLVQFTQDLIDVAVPWTKASSHAQPWWTEEVKELVTQERLVQ